MGVLMSKVHQYIQAICDDFMVGEFGPLPSVIDFIRCKKLRNFREIVFKTVSDF